MQISPPTDSLYKFSAIVGTILMVLSIYVPMRFYDDLIKQISEATRKLKINEIEIKYWGHKVAQLEKLRDDAIAMTKKGHKLDPNKVHLYYSEAEIKQMVKEMLEAGRETEIKAAETRVIAESIASLERRRHDLPSWAFASVILGLLLAIYGYLNWYFKIQVYQDRLLKLASEEAGRKKAKVDASEAVLEDVKIES